MSNPHFNDWPALDENIAWPVTDPEIMTDGEVLNK